VQSTGVAPYSYNWSTGETTSTILTTLAGDYCLVITDATGCEDSVCVTIGNTPPCNAYINEMVDPMGASYLLAMPDTFALGTVSYSWNTGETTQSIYPTQAGVYCVYILYSNTNCTGSYCFNYVPGNPIGGCSVYTTAIADSSLNNNFTFYAYPTGTAPFTYSWLFADGTTSTASAPSVQFANYLGVNWSSLTITDATGCVSSYCLVLPIVPPVDLCSADFSAYSNYQFGNPGEVFFQSYVQNVAGGAATYSWSFGDGSSSNLENPSHTYTTSGFYTICLTTTYNGCTYTSCKNEYVDLTWWTTNPFQGNCTASFMILTNQVANTGLINIINTSQGNNLYYTWSFGNGFISNSNLPFTTINNPGVYEICVSILDTLLNCSDTFCDTVTIDSLGNVYRDGMSGNIGILVSGTPQPNSILTTVDFKNSVNEINIAPNPSNGMFNLNSNWIEGTSLVEVFDIAGNIVRTLNINTTKGQKAVTIDLQDVADGSYLVRVVSNQRVQTVKLLVNH
jgi:PKD repeat protein